jgi:hypothetical protein
VATSTPDIAIYTDIIIGEAQDVSSWNLHKKSQWAQI